MSTFAQTQISPEQLAGATLALPDINALDTFSDTSGEPYIASERFHICDNIGGNLSVVYNAIDTQSDSSSVVPDSVIKVLLPNDGEYRHREALGTIELSVMESLPEHPNIIKYLGRGSIGASDGDNYRFIAMERANFGTLARPSEKLSDGELKKVCKM